MRYFWKKKAFKAIQVKILIFFHFSNPLYRQDSAVLVSSKGNTTTTPKIVPAAATNNNNNGNSNNSNDAKKTAGTVESQMTRSEKEERGKAFRQVVVAFIANIATINTGLIFGFSAVAIPQLEAEDSYIKVDKYQASWVGEWKFSICFDFQLELLRQNFKLFIKSNK